MLASHVLFQMSHPILAPRHSTDEEKVLSCQMMKYWAKFAHTV